MSKRRGIILCVVVEGLSQAETARLYGVSRGWVSKLVARYRLEGEAALSPRSRRPKTSPNATPPTVVELIIKTRRTLTSQGLDAGAETIWWHLLRHHGVTVLSSTIRRVLHRAKLIEPAPKKRPKTSFVRFEVGCLGFCGGGLVDSRCGCWLVSSLELDGCKHAKRGVASLTVVEDFEVLEDRVR